MPFIGNGFTTKDAGLAAQDDSRANVDVVTNAYLAGKHRAVADGARTGNAGQSDKDDTLADVAVVAHVHQVVNLRAAADARLFERSAVDGRVGTDLHIVFDGKRALLRKLRVLAGSRITYIPKPVTAQHRACLHYHTIADGGSGIDHDARVDVAVHPDGYVFANHRTGADDGSVANARVRPDHRARPHQHAGDLH